jgi:hypothetical protein
MAFIEQLRSWFDWAPWKRWRVVCTVESADEVPGALVGKEAILVGTRVNPKWLAFNCPCRTGHRILLNLDQNRYPYWTLLDLAKLTVRPSVDYRDNDRRCHYIVANGRIQWARHEGERHG